MLWAYTRKLLCVSVHVSPGVSCVVETRQGQGTLEWPCKPIKWKIPCMHTRCIKRIEQYHALSLAHLKASFYMHIIGYSVSHGQVGGCVMWVVGMGKDRRWEKRIVSIMFACMHEVCVRMREYMYFSVLFVRPHSTKTGGVCVCVRACVHVHMWCGESIMYF